MLCANADGVAERVGAHRGSCPTFIWTCGDGRYGQLGLPQSSMGPDSRVTWPTQVPMLARTPLRAVSAGGRSSFAITANDELYFWGHKCVRCTLAHGMGWCFWKTHTLPRRFDSVTLASFSSPVVLYVSPSLSIPLPLLKLLLLLILCSTPTPPPPHWMHSTHGEGGVGDVRIRLQPVVVQPLSKWRVVSVSTSMSHTCVVATARTAPIPRLFEPARTAPPLALEDGEEWEGGYGAGASKRTARWVSLQCHFGREVRTRPCTLFIEHLAVFPVASWKHTRKGWGERGFAIKGTMLLGF